MNLYLVHYNWFLGEHIKLDKCDHRQWFNCARGEALGNQVGTKLIILIIMLIIMRVTMLIIIRITRLNIMRVTMLILIIVRVATMI